MQLLLTVALAQVKLLIFFFFYKNVSYNNYTLSNPHAPVELEFYRTNRDFLKNKKIKSLSMCMHNTIFKKWEHTFHSTSSWFVHLLVSNAINNAANLNLV